MGWATPVWRLSGYPYRRYGLRRLTTLARLHVRRLGSVTRCFNSGRLARNAINQSGLPGRGSQVDAVTSVFETAARRPEGSSGPWPTKSMTNKASSCTPVEFLAMIGGGPFFRGQATTPHREDLLWSYRCLMQATGRPMCTLC